MSLDSLLFAVKNALKNVVRNSLLTFASVIVLTVSLISLGSTFLIVSNVNNFVDTAADKNQLVIFLDESLSEEDARALQSQFDAIGNLRFIRFETKEDALQNYKDQIGEENIIGLDASVFRMSYVYEIRDLSKYDQTLYRIEQIEGIGLFESGEKAIRTDHEIVSAIVNIRQVLTIFSGVVIAIFFVLSVFIITNSVKLSVFSRRTEINIMKYVGATDFYIRLPYFIEGLIIGLFSGILSYFVQRFLYNGIIAPVLQDFNLGTALPLDQNFGYLFFAFIVLGGLIGMIGSVFPVKKYLQV